MQSESYRLPHIQVIVAAVERVALRVAGPPLPLFLVSPNLAGSHRRFLRRTTEARGWLSETGECALGCLIKPFSVLVALLELGGHPRRRRRVPHATLHVERSLPLPIAPVQLRKAHVRFPGRRP